VAKKGKNRRGKRQKIVGNDFRVVLDLPERLVLLLLQFLHVSRADWTFLMDRIRQHKTDGTPIYTEWFESKGRGRGRRYFAAPCEELKLVQRAILHRFLSTVQVHFVRHGNQPGSSILTSAETHAGAKSMFAVDIVNAFPSVFRSRIEANLKGPWEHACRMFQGVELSEADKEMMLETIVDLVAWRDRLPQGPPTSPRILDIVCLRMDKQLYELFISNGTVQSYRSTAYVDDLTFSCNTDSIPEELREKALEIIRKNGFIPHKRADKTVYYSPETGRVPIVLGLVICHGGRITMTPRKVNQLRARLHTLLTKEGELDDVSRGQLQGTIGFIRQVYPKKLPAKLRQIVEQVERRLTAEKSGATVTIVIEALPELETSNADPELKDAAVPQQDVGESMVSPASVQEVAAP